MVGETRRRRTRGREVPAEYAGKLQFYMGLVEDKLRRASPSPTVGILICDSRNDHTVRYALSQSTAAMAVSTYADVTLTEAEQQTIPDEDDLAAALDWNGLRRANTLSKPMTTSRQTPPTNRTAGNSHSPHSPLPAGVFRLRTTSKGASDELGAQPDGWAPTHFSARHPLVG
ncbi:PDDEXK nuclease domain-containing protein [Arthrobacter rhombi]|uniref:PDDEXK nuclease domain-containing protein n=1 Tax=Arthrobacter rhombi TaxID=71253 RepID=UPI003FD49B36